MAKHDVPVEHADRMTNHACHRLQQRGIPPWFVALLVSHGRTQHDAHGAMIKTEDRATRRDLRCSLSRTQYAAAERHFNVYVVVADDQDVITAAHRTRRRRLNFGCLASEARQAVGSKSGSGGQATHPAGGCPQAPSCGQVACPRRARLLQAVVSVVVANLVLRAGALAACAARRR